VKYGEMIMSYESGGMWKVVVKGYFKALS